MFTISDDLEMKPAKCGCEGCVFEDQPECPGYETNRVPHFENCSLEGRAMIFVKKENKDEPRI